MRLTRDARSAQRNPQTPSYAGGTCTSAREELRIGSHVLIQTVLAMHTSPRLIMTHQLCCCLEPAHYCGMDAYQRAPGGYEYFIRNYEKPFMPTDISVPQQHAQWSTCTNISLRWSTRKASNTCAQSCTSSNHETSAH